MRNLSTDAWRNDFVSRQSSRKAHVIPLFRERTPTSSVKREMTKTEEVLSFASSLTGLRAKVFRTRLGEYLTVVARETRVISTSFYSEASAAKVYALHAVSGIADI